MRVLRLARIARFGPHARTRTTWVIEGLMTAAMPAVPAASAHIRGLL
jgi:hypothetical protein